MFWLVASIARWNARRPVTLVERKLPMPASEQVHRLCHRRARRRLEPLLGTRQILCNRLDLHCISRVGGVTAALKPACESLCIAARVERTRVARVVAQDLDIIAEAVRGRVVRAEFRLRGRWHAAVELERPGGHAVALPTATGLDAEEIVAGPAIGIAGQGLAPARFERGLRQQMFRIDAERLARFLGA